MFKAYSWKILTKLVNLVLLTLLVLAASSISGFLSAAHAQEKNPDLCYNTEWHVHRYTHVKSGDAVIYQVPSNYNITPTNLSCILATEFISKAQNMPRKMLIGLASTDGRQAFLARWSLDGDFFSIIEIRINPGEYTGMGTFTFYPEPLARIKNIITSTKFPRQEDLPVHLRNKFKVNSFNSSIPQIKGLLGEDSF